MNDRARPTPKVRLSRKASQGETRLRLIASAIELFAEEGVAEASMNGIAERAGFSRGAVHGNYSDKHELIAAVIESVVADLAPTLDGILAASHPSQERLEAYIRAFLSYCAAKPGSANALMAAVEYFGRRDPQHYAARAAESVDGLVRLFEDGQRRGEMRAFDSRTMALAMRSVLDTAAQQFLRTSHLRVDALSAELVALFTAATKPEAAE